ncbi:anti-sigma factor family protein [Salinithrix halophila]|uniref:Anti-sigma-W factor RsiW n=1 Tax=Salinithrix halophila TaxID=1485204 RepID=A0ABV8JI08_9BACL
MTCKDEGLLQAYIDGELARNERKEMAMHIEQCSDCQSKLNQMKESEDWIRIVMEESFSHPSQPVRIDPEDAWARFQQRLADDGEYEKPEKNKGITPMKRGWDHMKKSTKRWISGVAAAGVLLGAFSIPQVQAAASEWLSVFRLSQVEYVKVTEQDLQKTQDWLDNQQVGSLDLKGLGKVRTEGNKKDQIQSFDNYSQAEKAGHSLPKLPKGYESEEVAVHLPYTIHFQLNTKNINKLMKTMETGVQLDENLNGKSFNVTIPKYVALRLTDKDSSDSIEYMEGDAPEIKVEKGVDVDQLRKTLLSLPFVPENIKTQLMAMDWQKTLPIPVFEEQGKKVREVNIDGEKGIIQKDGWMSTLLWQKDGKIRVLSIYDKKATKDQLIQLAQQFN